MAAALIMTPMASPRATPTKRGLRDSCDDAMVQLRREQQAKREAALQRRRWRHRAVQPINGVGLQQLLSLSERDWRRWPLTSREGRTNGSEHVMVFTAEDFSGGSGDGWSTVSSGCTTDDGELSEDWEDPLWVKDENVRTAGKCAWAAIPRSESTRRMKKKSRRGRDAKEVDQGYVEDEADSLVSSNEVSWIIDDSSGTRKGMGVTEPEEQDAEEEDQRTRARGGTESSSNVHCERGVEYLLQKYYYSSLPVLPTRLPPEGASVIVLNEDEDNSAIRKPVPHQAQCEKEEKKLVPQLQIESTLSTESPSGSKRHRKHKEAKSKERQPEVSTSSSSSPLPATKEHIKSKAGRHLINMFNLSPRRRDNPKRSSVQICKRDFHDQEASYPEQHKDEAVEKIKAEVLHDQGDQSESEDSWIQALRKPTRSRRKRSISIPLSSYRLELEMKSASNDDGSSGKSSSFTRRLRMRGGAASSAQSRKVKDPTDHKKFNTVSSMSNMRKHSSAQD